MILPLHFLFFFFNDPATTEIYTLSLHDALPIWRSRTRSIASSSPGGGNIEHRTLNIERRTKSATTRLSRAAFISMRSEEHTSELQSQSNLVCRLLLEKKKKKKISQTSILFVSIR